MLHFQASTGYRETPDSTMRQWADGAGFPSPRNHQDRTQTHSAGHASGSQIREINTTLVKSHKQQKDEMYVCGKKKNLRKLTLRLEMLNCF